jgi:uncharacterized protein YbbC (DUF1343 family)
MSVVIGLDRVRDHHFHEFLGQTVGLIVNQASVGRDYRHALELFHQAQQAATLRIGAIFGPEHGLYGHTQDNMIEWEGEPDPRTGAPVYSLYGRLRKPAPEWLAGLDRLVFDIPDIGSRYYTFVWTMAHAMEAAAEHGVPFTVFDRPNPIDGVTVEGPVLEPDFASFVGLYPVPTRHGLTAGELARYLRERYLPGLDLSVVEPLGWDREMYADQTGVPWVPPSPNMPTVETAMVYPGGCLLEATNLSEGRGTTRPFETFGAPWLDGWALADDLNAQGLEGVFFRPIVFEPTFNKHKGEVCQGCFLHVTDRHAFRPWRTYVAVIQACIRQTGLHDSSAVPRGSQFVAASGETHLKGFAWKQPPYEYVHDRMPIDILAGNAWLRPMIESSPLSEIEERADAESEAFEHWRLRAIT